MLFTGKGDGGETDLWACDQRISKSSAVAEALGSLDEINSLLGLCKLQSRQENFLVGEKSVEEVVADAQQTLFIIQAELAGTPMTVEAGKVEAMSALIGEIEKMLPPIHSFFVSGGILLSTYFDYARTVARRAERRVVASQEEKKKIGPHSLAYLNRLSSLLYALARLANHKSGITEERPHY